MGNIGTRRAYQERLMQLQAEDKPETAAVRALELLGRSRGWDTPPAPRARRPKPIPSDPLEARSVQLTEVRAQLAAAEAAGSHVAARGYRSDARTLQLEIEAMREARRLEAERQIDVEGRLRAFRDDLKAMPRRLQLRIRAIVLEEVGEDG